MSRVKAAINSLCKSLRAVTNVTLQPEYFRKASNNNISDGNVIVGFWKVLYVLSHSIVEEKYNINSERFGLAVATKLLFAVLQYPSMYFYSLDEGNKSTRELLLALAWLLGEKKVLDKMIAARVADSIVGKEFSFPENYTRDTTEVFLENFLSTELNTMVNVSGKINYNIKEIDELSKERIKLASRVHAASKNTFGGLPHLSVAETAFLKRLAIKCKSEFQPWSNREIQEMLEISEVLNAYTRWAKERHVFFDWMVEVVQDDSQERFFDLEDPAIIGELRRFCEFLRNLTNEKETHRDAADVVEERSSPTPRFVVTPKDETTRVRIVDATGRLAETKLESRNLQELLARELRIMLESIPNCVKPVQTVGAN